MSKVINALPSPVFGIRNNQCAEIVSTLKDCGALCDRAISVRTGLNVNVVCARRNDLVGSGVVKCYFKAVSPFSNVRVKHWGLC